MSDMPIEEVTGPITAGDSSPDIEEEGDDESEADGLAKDEVTPDPGASTDDAGTGWGAAVDASAQAKDGEEVIFKVEGRQLGVPLSEEEFHSVAKSLAETHETIDTIEIEKAEVVQRLGGRLKTLYAEASSRAKSLRKGEKVEWVDVEIVHVPSQNRKFARRKDTGAVLEDSEEAMTPNDRQLAIDFPNGGGGDHAGDLDPHDGDDLDGDDDDGLEEMTAPDDAEGTTIDDEIAKADAADENDHEEAKAEEERTPAKAILAAGKAAKAKASKGSKKSGAKAKKKKPTTNRTSRPLATDSSSNPSFADGTREDEREPLTDNTGCDV